MASEASWTLAVAVSPPSAVAPAEQRPGAAPRQQHSDLAAGQAGLLGGKFAGRPVDPPVWAVHQVEGDAPVGALPLGQQVVGFGLVDDEVHRPQCGGAQAARIAAIAAKSKSSTKTSTVRRAKFGG
jgi:hypothetical protein